MLTEDLVEVVTAVECAAAAVVVLVVVGYFDRVD